MFLASQVFAMSQALLNDVAAQVFTNTYLMPYLNIALRDLGSLMNRANIQITTVSSDAIQVFAGDDNIGGPDPGDPDLPTDLVEILGMYQRQPNSGQNYFLVTRMDTLPHVNQENLTAFIPCWSWQEQIIHFIPATGDLEIKLDFVKSVVPTIISDNDQITIIGSMNYLGYRTAALAANYIGENPTRAEALNNEAIREWDWFEGINTKGKQATAYRRRPFRTRNWGRGI